MRNRPSPDQISLAQSAPPRLWLDFLPGMDAYPYSGGSAAYYPWAVEIDHRRSWRAHAGRALRRQISQWLGVIGPRRRPDPGLTPYPCRLPNGTMGRAAAVFVEGEWTLVCRPEG